MEVIDSKQSIKALREILHSNIRDYASGRDFELHKSKNHFPFDSPSTRFNSSAAVDDVESTSLADCELSTREHCVRNTMPLINCENLQIQPDF